MGRRPQVVIATFVVWTLAVWVGRVRNVIDDEELRDGEQAARLALAAVFLALAVVVAAVLAVARGGDHRWVERLRTAVDVLFVVTAVVWVIRGTDILVDGDHDAGFKAVHTVLAVVSIAWAELARRATRQAPGLEQDRTLQPR